MRQHVGARLEHTRRAALLQFFTAEPLGREHHLGGQRCTKLFLHDECRPHTGGESILHEVRAVHAFLRHDDHVGVQPEYKTPAGRMALHGRDNRHVAGQESLIEKRHISAGALPVGQTDQPFLSPAHPEHAVAAGEDHRLECLVGGDLSEGVDQSADDRVRQHVAMFPVTHGDQRNAPIDNLRRHRFGRHARHGWTSQQRRLLTSIEPAPLGSERIGRKMQTTRAGAGMECAPRHQRAAQPQGAKRGPVARGNGLLQVHIGALTGQKCRLTGVDKPRQLANEVRNIVN